MGIAAAQTEPERPYFSRLNTFGVFMSYSGDSSHMLLGEAEQRTLLQLGVSYRRRLLLTDRMNWQFDAEFMPVVLEGDPLTHFVNNQTSPTNGTYSGNYPYRMVQCAPVVNNYDFIVNGVTYSGTEVETCSGRSWTKGQALSPFGMQLNLRPRTRLQPFVIGHAGYMFSTQSVPIDGAGSFNFTFDCGAGVEYFLSVSKSVRIEYRYHHLSNADSAHLNPGVDNGLLQVTYSFGR